MPDSVEKAAIWLLTFVALIVAAILGVGLWAFVELVLWLTSK